MQHGGSNRGQGDTGHMARQESMVQVLRRALAGSTALVGIVVRRVSPPTALHVLSSPASIRERMARRLALVWGLLGYTLYLVWAGTTTNESLKWSVFRDDMNDGCAFRRPLAGDRDRNPRTEPPCPRWPVEPDHVLVATSDGKPPADESRLPGEGEWERVWGLRCVENLYDMGLWDNLADILIKDYGYGSGTNQHQPAVEDQGRARKAVKSNPLT